MSALPQGWVETTLGEIVALRGDKVDPARVPEKSFIGLEDIEPHTSAILRVGTASEVKSSVVCFEAGDVLYSRLRPYLNKVTRPDFSGVASAEILALKPGDAAEAEFVRRKIMTRGFLDFTAMLDKGDRPRVSYDEIAAFQFPLPPLPEQRRIVAKIDSLTGKSRRARDHLDHIPRLVEKYKQAILAAAFRGELCIKRRSPKLLPLSEFIDSLDQGWSPKCASEPAGSNDWGVIKTTAIQSVQFLPQENKRLPADLTPRPGIVINAGDVLITRAGPRSRVAISCLVTGNHPKLMLCDKAYRLRINPEMADPAFMTYMLNTPQCLSELEVMKTGISDSGLNLTQGKFIALEIPAFSLPEQSEIIRRIQSAFVWIDRLAADATSARKLIDHLDQSVLAKALKGELVPQDPADEPASILLERIRAERAAAPKAKRGCKKTA